MENEQKGKEKEETESKWIQPLALSLCVKKFENLCQIIFREAKEKQKKSPIMICGPTGVGKTMFVDEFEKMARAEYEIRKKEDKEKNNEKSTLKDKLEIVPLNCATFNSDLLISEIFGHVKGAFTGANKSKEGLVVKANGGVLILEEIGELPEDGQAKLLTFLEDGYYYRVGGLTRKEADVQIVATTNKEKDDFREDFWFRFFPFFVPPLHQRREDVLHYLGHSSPDIFKQLKPWEALSLLAYHWPGNVREIERVSRMIEWEKQNNKRRQIEWMEDNDKTFPFSRDSLDHLTGLKETYTSLSATKSKTLKSRLKESGIDTDLLELLLNKYGLFLSPKDGINNKTFWHFIISYSNLFKKEGGKILIRDSVKNKLHDSNEYVDYAKLFKMMIREKIIPGLEFFCALFLIDIKSNANLLDFVAGDITMPDKSPLSFIEDPQPKHHKLVKGIIEYRIGGKLPKEIKDIPDSSTEEYDQFKKTIISRAETTQKARRNEDEKTNLSAMTEKGALHDYYKKLYRETGGNVQLMASIADKGKSTIRDKMKKFNLTESTEIRVLHQQTVLITG